MVHSSKAKELLTNPALGLGLELFGITTAVLRCGCERCFCTTDDHRRTSHCPNSVGIAERVAASRLRCPFFSIERRRCALLDQLPRPAFERPLGFILGFIRFSAGVLEQF